MEIERKFLIQTLPEGLEQYPCQRIEQAYLNTSPVIRIRRKDEQYILTCKGQGLRSREEHELSLTAEEYRNLLAKAEGRIVVKRRYLIPCGPYTVELDVFEQPVANLLMAEVEFPTEEEADAFSVPLWFGREVTYDPAYTNAALSKNDDTTDDVQPGRYRHFKGNEYQVISVARHSETQEPMVVYRALYGDRGMWVRPVSMWNEIISRDGWTGPRFAPVE